MFLILFRNILYPQQMFPSLRSMKTQHSFCVPRVCAPKKHHEQRCVRNSVSSFARAFKLPNKDLMTDLKGNGEFCFPKNIEVEGKQNSLFPAEPVIKYFVTPPDPKLGKTGNKSFALRRLAHKFAAVSRSTT